MLEQALLYYYALCACFLIILLLLRREQRGNTAYEVVVLLMLPFAGMIIVLLSYWQKRKYANETTHQLLLASDEMADTLGREVYRSVNVEKESNIVPLEEALLVNDPATRRRMILDVLKDDSFQYIQLLQTAVSNEDTETSHYAVSAVMEIKRKLMLGLQKWSVEYEADKKDILVLTSYSQVLKQYMESGFLDERTLRRYRYTYSQVLANLIEADRQNESFYEERINCELTLGRVDEAYKICEELMEFHPDKEISYVMKMKVCYTTKAHKEFHQTLNELKKSPIKVNSTTLNYIRFWSKGVHNEIST